MRKTHFWNLYTKEEIYIEVIGTNKKKMKSVTRKIEKALKTEGNWSTNEDDLPF